MKHLGFSFFLLVELFAFQKISFAQNSDSVLLYFASPQSAPCQMMKPLLTQLEREGTPVRYVDVLNEPYFSSRYGVRATPTFIVTSGGSELTRLVGVQGMRQIRRALATPEHGKLVPTHSLGVSSRPFESQSIRQDLRASGSNPFNNREIGLGSSESRSTRNAVTLERMSEVMPNRSVAHSIERAKSATVRMRVYDATGYGIGTGTIIDARNGEALIITCGHLFRDSNRQTRVEVDLFRGGQCETVIARIIDFDAEVHDIGLVSIRTNQLVHAVKIAGGSQPVRNGETVFSFGCDRGEIPSRHDTRITGINKYDQHLGLSNLEIDGAPLDGRSGGGLFDEKGQLVGICNAADYRENIGIYAGPGSIQWQLRRIGMEHLISGL